MEWQNASKEKWLELSKTAILIKTEGLTMGFLFFYTNFIRALIMIITAVQISKRRFKKLIPAAVVLALSFIPWLLSLLDIEMNPLTVFYIKPFFSWRRF
jgi:hypothetical protein